MFIKMAVEIPEDHFKKVYGIPSHLSPVFSTAAERRDMIRKNTVKSLANSFPITTDKFTLELEGIEVDDIDVSPDKQKEAVLKRKTLAEKVFGTLVLKDADGKVVEKKKQLLMKLPFLNDDHSFVVDGNPYAVRSQIRTKPGVYTRKRGNDEIEASFNLAKGSNFRLSLSPEKGQLNIEMGTSKIPLYPILRGLGYSHKDIADSWGEGIAELNKSSDLRRNIHVNKLFEKLIPDFARKNYESTDEKIDAIRDYYNTRTSMDPTVTKNTLGVAYDKVTPGSLLTAGDKLLKVFRKGEDTDDRDSLAYQTLKTTDDFFAERINLDKRAITTKAKKRMGSIARADKLTISSILPPDTFGKGIKSFLTTSSLSSTPTQINPMEIIDLASTITRLGEGGIGSERAIPMDARKLHGTHLGTIDPFRTPESSHAGIDVRAALNLAKDEHGNMYTPVHNLKTDQLEYVPVTELENEPIAFPKQEVRKGNVDCLQNGQVVKKKPDEVKYKIPHANSMFAYSTAMLPFIESMQGNRTLMGTKMQTQAVPLLHREEPLVQAGSANPKYYRSVENEVAHKINAISPVDGKVTKIENSYIYVTSDADGKEYKVPYRQNYPLASKTFIHHDPIVKVGDTVKTEQLLTESNFTKNGATALGTNMKIAYLADKGNNSNDAVVISESAAKKLTSSHMYTKVFEIDDDTKLGKDAHSTHAPNIFNTDQYGLTDSNGIIKKGTKIKSGDPLIVSVRRTEPSTEDMMLGRLHKSLVRPYADNSLTWDKDIGGEIVDATKSGNKIAVTIKTEEQARIGDKISNRYGGKGVVGKILTDEDMYKDAEGKPIDILMTSAGVISRINPSQVHEVALGKVATKRGQPYVVDHFEQRDNTKWVKSELKKHGVKDKETVTDPVTGKQIPNIMVGNGYILKLFKSTDTNYAARGIGGYDALDQPKRGGTSGAKSLGGMEVNALLAHNARNILWESKNLRGQKNSEYWRAVQMGLPAPSPKENFAYSKFKTMLQGSGIRVNETPTDIALAPLTDNDILKMSSGKVENSKRLRSKDLKPEKGGLFDEGLTGGVTGTKWTHIELPEPVLNPVFEDPARRLLGLTKKGFSDLANNTGGDAIRQQLNNIVPSEKIAELKQQLPSLKGAARDNAIKQIKALQALDKTGLRPGDAYTLKNFPVIPPVTRPILPSNTGGQLLIDDANWLYRDLIISKDKLKELKDIGLPAEFLAGERDNLYKAVTATVGLGDPVSPQARSKKVKGFISNIHGTNPKTGYFQTRLLKHRMDFSGRGTAAPDPTLDIDEVGIPEKMAWSLYEPFVVSQLVQQGHKKLDALEAVENKTPVARNALVTESRRRPVLVNRAPTLHRYNIVAATPKLISGKTIRTNPFIEDGMNLDFDGDALQIHVPVTEAGIKDANNMKISKLLFGDKEKDNLLVQPKHEALVGIYKATSQAPASDKVHKFKTAAEARKAYLSGKIKTNDLIEIEDK